MSHLCSLVAESAQACLRAGEELRTRSAAKSRMLQILSVLESPEQRAGCVAIEGGAWRLAPDALPVEKHADRMASGLRGLSLPALRALRQFFEQRDALRRPMTDICRSDGVNFSACALTASTGLSLAETIVRRCKADGLSPTEWTSLVGPATCFFSYSWTGTAVGDMLDSIMRVIDRLEAEDGKARFVWIDMFGASQNLLAGAYLPSGGAAREALKTSDRCAFLACKEDTDRIFDSAIDAVDEILFYFSEMGGQWDAPPHPFLLAERGDNSPPMRNERWVRTGPGALSRAWCLMELSKALAKGCRLHLTLNATDLQSFENLVEKESVYVIGDYPALFQQFMASVEVRDAQVSKVEDREFILSVINRLDGGLGEINARVMESFRMWALDDLRGRISRLPAHKRGTSQVQANLVGALLQAASTPEQLDELVRLSYACVAAHRQAFGEHAVSTREALVQNAAALLQHGMQHGRADEVDEVETIALKLLEIESQLGADGAPRVDCYARILLSWVRYEQSAVLQERGEVQRADRKQADAEALARQVLADLRDRTALGDEKWVKLTESMRGRVLRLFAGYSLGASLLALGRLEEAAEELRATLAYVERDEALSKNIFACRARAFDAVLRHQMSGGDTRVQTKAKADLEQVYKYMREHLGAGNWFVRRVKAQMNEMKTTRPPVVEEMKDVEA